MVYCCPVSLAGRVLVFWAIGRTLKPVPDQQEVFKKLSLLVKMNASLGGNVKPLALFLSSYILVKRGREKGWCLKRVMDVDPGAIVFYLTSAFIGLGGRGEINHELMRLHIEVLMKYSLLKGLPWLNKVTYLLDVGSYLFCPSTIQPLAAKEGKLGFRCLISHSFEPLLWDFDYWPLLQRVCA